MGFPCKESMRLQKILLVYLKIFPFFISIRTKQVQLDFNPKFRIFYYNKVHFLYFIY